MLAAEEELHSRYPDALFRSREFEERAREHGIRFSLHTPPHHRAAVLDFLDNPDSMGQIPAISASIWTAALNSQAIDENGDYVGTMAHPVNQARYKLVYNFLRHTCPNSFSPHYNETRAAWTIPQWLQYERVEAELRAQSHGPCLFKEYADHTDVIAFGRPAGASKVTSSYYHRDDRPTRPACRKDFEPTRLNVQ